MAANKCTEEIEINSALRVKTRFSGLEGKYRELKQGLKKLKNEI